MDFTILTYLIYLPFGLGAAWLAGQSLYKNGYAMLLDVFDGRKEQANSVNRLLLAGFYMLTIGYLSLRMPVEGSVANFAHMLEILSAKLGILLVILGATHVLVMGVLFKMRGKVAFSQ
ncbi:MAG: hypothetical protein AB8F95_09910 [Bacteroidia bacterium]